MVRFVFLILMSLSLIPLPVKAAPSDLQRFEFKETHFGLDTLLIFYAPDEQTARKASTAAFQRVSEVEAALASDPESDLSRVMAGAGDSPVKVGEDLFAMLQVARRLSEATDGAFDVTLRPLFGVWRTVRETGTLPTPAVLRKARETMGWERIRLNEKDRTVSLPIKGMAVDLNALSKGYAGDVALAELKRQGITRSYFDSGGDIVAGDPPPGERGWRVEVENARMDGENWAYLANQSISASGEPERFSMVAGKPYFSMIDARTGLGTTEGYAVSVIAPTGALADGLATALSIYGPDAGCSELRRFPNSRAWFRRVSVQLEKEAGTGNQLISRWQECGSSR